MTVQSDVVAGGDRARLGERITTVVGRLSALFDELDPADANRYFLSTYLRTTIAVGKALRDGVFEDAEWVERWDVAFAELYLEAIAASREGRNVPTPWAVAFRTAKERPDLPPLRHVLLGINAHINFDLPQALLKVMTDEDFDDPVVRQCRARDHSAIDLVLSSRVGAEDAELEALGPRSLIDRVLAPLNQVGTKRFLKEAREKVWANAAALSAARRLSAPELAERLDALSRASTAKLEELVAPGQVLLKLAVSGFGVSLESASRARERRSVPSRHRSFDPRLVGRLERDAWAAYYQHRWLRLLVVSVGLVRAGFRLGTIGTLRGAWHVLRANQLWSPVPDNDPEGARRHMTAFYALVRDAAGEMLDPVVAARLEVEWWRIHRALQRDGGGDGLTVEDLVGALADLYAYAYGVAREAVLPAARERAEAMVISDQWVADGCHPDSEDLRREAEALVRSYAALLSVVHR